MSTNPPPRFKLRSVIVANDVRQETSGQQTIVGVYVGFLGANTIPVVLPQLYFRIEFESNIDTTATCQFAVVAPSGRHLIQQSTPMRITKSPINIYMLGGAPVVFPEQGKYQICFGVGVKAKIIDTFEIKLGLPPPSTSGTAAPQGKPRRQPKTASLPKP